MPDLVDLTPVSAAHDWLRAHGYPDADRAAVQRLWDACPIRTYLERKAGAWPAQYLVRTYVENPASR